jgi:hypothetical protein
MKLEYAEISLIMRKKHDIIRFEDCRRISVEYIENPGSIMLFFLKED